MNQQASPFVFNGRKTIASMLSDVDTLQDDAQIIQCLRAMPASVKPVLMGMFHPDIEWLLPPGAPPYKQSIADVPSMLHQEARRLYLFWKGGNPNLTATRREALFIVLLESLAKEDADLVLACKDRNQSTFTNIQGYHVAQAWPDQAILAAYPSKVARAATNKRSTKKGKGNDAASAIA